ncbi:MAG: D-cysteine desulfhydrase [Rhodospirillales bacterium]|jgi:L-cysteate sulfo-lyase|nr:D-cysteine desulfhydrase [Rhodospirillales bacterium]MDP6774616.1 D-cysteine desulfhydrase [Rhodospirillales bacterium]
MHYPLTERLKRVPLAHTPTPLEPLPRLAEHLGGPAIYVKRDDATGLAFGGNKTRKLEFLMADALDQGADTVITVGGVQSNHVRQTVAAAAKLGLKAEAVLSDIVEGRDGEYFASGNVLVDHLMGAGVHVIEASVDAAGYMEDLADTVRGRGGVPYIVPMGGSNPVGALGYVRCAEELAAQDTDIGVTHVVHASGSAGTQAGLAGGLAALGSPLALVAIGVKPSNGAIRRDVEAIVPGVLDLLGFEGEVPTAHLHVNEDYSGPGYGLPTDGMVEAVTTVARLEGLLLDPVYTGKAMAGLFDLARTGKLDAKDTVVFVHTGGAPGLFAYPTLFQGS